MSTIPAIAATLTRDVEESPGLRGSRCSLSDPAAVAELAALLAEAVVESRCGANARLVELWRARAQGDGGPHSGRDRVLLEDHLLQNFGPPEDPAPLEHLEGAVFEHLWYALTVEHDGHLGLPIHVPRPSWSVTDPGLDGLAIYLVAGQLVFRLWELKRHAADSAVRQTVSAACRQVRMRAGKYLARYAAVEQRVSDDLAELVAKLPELWADDDGTSGTGIAVGISTGADTADCLEPISQQFPSFTIDQLEGLIAELPDFSAFAELVREELWKGL